MRPSFTISTASHIPRRLQTYACLACSLDADGLDIDATTWIGRRTGLRAMWRRELAAQISSIWVTPADLPLLPFGRESAGPLGRENAAQIVVRLPEFNGVHQDQAAIIAAQEVARIAPWVAGIVTAVPARATDGGRAHLTRLRGLRRLAEEWDVRIALDLSQATDARWEAEAAIQIAGPRLSMLRIHVPIQEGMGRHSDVVVRALRACADRDFRGTISIAPSTPYWLAWSSSALLRDLSANRDAILRIFRERPTPIERANSASFR